MALPSGTITFLFSDIEGSTQFARKLGQERYGEALADHASLLRAAFGERDGREIDMQGDSFFVAFARARDAVYAAADAQRALAKHSWPEGVDVRVRMGLHTGEAALSDDRYLGVAVHRAARICSAAHGGQVLLLIPGCRGDFPALRAAHHLGRLIDHVHLRVRDLEASKR